MNQESSKPQEPATHACDAPGLTGTQFLYAVMRDRSLPLTTRIKAAGKLMQVEPDGPPRPTVKIVIEGFPSSILSQCQGHESVTQAPDGKIGNQQSFPPEDSKTHHPHDDDPGDPNLMTTNTDPLTYDDIQQIKAAVQRLHPEADLSEVPDHLTLCECGHWLLYPCKCARIH